jgi:recombination protein RecA
MTNTARKTRIQRERLRLDEKYGRKTGTLMEGYERNVIPTGILDLDYALGIGGYERGMLYHVYGAPDVGKSSAVILPAFREALRLGLQPGLVAVEPSWDEEWVAKNDVDPNEVIVAFPDNGHIAFEILYEWVTGQPVGPPLDLVVLDSIGALLTTEEASGGKKQAFGQAGLITDGVKKIAMAARKNNVTVIFLNQLRDDNAAKMAGITKPPGGWALRHTCPVWLKVSASNDSTKVHKEKIHGNDVVVGRELSVKVERNKLAEGTGQVARFDYYQKLTEEHPVGPDRVQDMIQVGQRTKVVGGGGGGVYQHHTFPNGKLKGKAKIRDFLDENPDAYEIIRQEVLHAMDEEQAALKREREEREKRIAEKLTRHREKQSGDQGK